MIMKKLVLLFSLMFTFTLSGCGGDSDGDDSQNDNIKTQEQSFAKVKNNIIGKWYATEVYNDGSYSDYITEPLGWRKLHDTSNLMYIEFGKDNTYTEKTPLSIEKGTYKIYENNEYLSIPSLTVPVYIDFTGKIDTETRGITIEGGYLRLYGIYYLQKLNHKVADFTSYPANYRYIKQ
jgi:hypothetical protein